MKKKLVPLAAMAAVAVVLLAGSAVFLEIALRLKNRFASRGGAPAYQAGGEEFFAPIFEPHPYLIVYNLRNFAYKGIHTNSVGFRGRTEYPMRKEPGTKRVFLMGGSAAVGMYASSDEHTISAYLEKALNEAGDGTRYEVINSGCAGFNSHQDLVLLGLEVMQWDPDIVVSFAGGTDLNTSMSPKWHRNYHELIEAQEKLVTHPWYQHSQAYQFVSARLPKGAAATGPAPGVFHGEAPLAYLDNIRSMAGIAAVANVKFLAVLQPSIPLSTKQLTAKEKQGYERAMKRGALPANYEDLAKRLYAAVGEGAKRYALPQGTAFLDGSDLFAGTDFDAFVDAFHLTDEGNRFTAAAIQKEMTRLAWVGRKPSRAVSSADPKNPH